MIFNKQILILTLLLLRLNLAFAADTAWQKSEFGEAQTILIAQFRDGKIAAEMHFKLGAGWKIYGQHSEGIGVPPSFDFSGSTNYSSHQIIWPKAEDHEEKIGTEIFKYSTYQKEVTLPIDITPQDSTKPTNLTLKLDFGLCKDVCIPVTQKFSLQVPTTTTPPTLPLTTNHLPLTTYILLALLGGLILNIMPCVLPVLSIKLLSIINHPRARLARIRFAFLATIIGIIFCFVIFALLASLLKFSGNEFGWGLQFQNPYFLIFLIIITSFFTANLLGKFEINFSQIAATFLHKKISTSEKKENIFIPNFLSGILATLLATPCSAPFLGSAISFALTKELSLIFLIFFWISIGFAAPYILLFFAPKLVYIFPKPGIWMEKVKHLMAILMAATVLWLVYILSHNLLNKDHKDRLWYEFDEAKISYEVKRGKLVLVDITADWCLTCKFNKTNVLQSKEIVALLTSGEIIGLRGDITKPDPKIMEFMRKHNRFAIPFNAVHGPKAKDGLLTSELLNKEELLKLIEQAK
ncbi:MAG: hypothetical protein FJX34_02295 [Alphaproteobacteria bacterium]|nr:hypothetical protein [Alphaproteobacteria bacterium]